MNAQVLHTVNDYGVLLQGEDIYVAQYIDDEWVFVYGYWHDSQSGMYQALDLIDDLMVPVKQPL